ncbi:MAG: tRNA pseudouridine(55) synthase TruB [Bacteroidetes bacterium]|nr:MAG: tRNA pseudouridine(55) synthase TruB [Bacteroidota bacterium]
MIDKHLTDLGDFQTGQVILFDKPLEWTSFNIVKKTRNLIRKKYSYKKIKVGHAGTLDPLATGLLIVCTGKFTKQIEKYQAQEKEYIATLRLGQTTPSFDLETEVDKEFPINHITENLFKEALKKFIGEQKQIPPNFSAKFVDGKRAYVKARNGEDFEIRPNNVNISEIEITDFSLPTVKIRISCSKGTYIRALARDIGEALQSGAHLTGLRRTKIGEFNVDDAISIVEFEDLIKKA